MGHKVPPLANRLGFTKNWNSRWYARRQTYGLLLNEDDRIRRHLRDHLTNAAMAKVEIERTAARVRLIIHSARPGIIIGRRGADIDRLREDLHALTKRELAIDIKEVKNPAIEAQLVAENIAFQLEKQISFRRAMKRALQLSMSAGALGVKVRCAGRLGGAEMSRVESYREGKIPLGTFRADIDFGFAEAKTTYGRIGVKCWICKGDSLLPRQQSQVVPHPSAAATREGVPAPSTRPRVPASPGPSSSGPAPSGREG